MYMRVYILLKDVMSPEQKIEIVKKSILNFELESGITLGDFFTEDIQYQELEQTLLLLAEKLELGL